MNTTTAHTEAEQTSSQPLPERSGPQPLCRPVDDRMIAGVAAGVARYLSIDVTVVRIVMAVLVIAGGFGLPLYIAGWLLIPEEGRERSILEDFIQSRAAGSR